jgi:hypothetical protein
LRYQVRFYTTCLCMLCCTYRSFTHYISIHHTAVWIIPCSWTEERLAPRPGIALTVMLYVYSISAVLHYVIYVSHCNALGHCSMHSPRSYMQTCFIPHIALYTFHVSPHVYVCMYVCFHACSYIVCCVCLRVCFAFPRGFTSRTYSL